MREMTKQYKRISHMNKRERELKEQTFVNGEDPINNVSMHTALCTRNHAPTGIPSDWT